jgi:autotransporter-associated beta strand protein
VLLPGTVAGGTGGSNLAGLHGNDGGAAGSGIFVQSGTTVALGVGQTSGQVTEVDGVIADDGLGKLAVSGAGTVLLTAANTFAGGITLLSGTLELAQNSSAGYGAITFNGGSLRLDANAVDGLTYGQTLSSVEAGDRIDLRGLAFQPGATAVLNGADLVVVSGAVTEHFTLENPGRVSFVATSDGAAGTPGVLLTAVPLPTISGTVASQATTSEAPIHPFANVVITDPNVGATDSATITLSGYGGVLSGAGLSGGANGVYTLAAATPAALMARDEGSGFHAHRGRAQCCLDYLVRRGDP